MALQIPVAVTGHLGSPYTFKMLAVLRFRHIPYRFLTTNNPANEAMPKPRVRLVPIFYLPGEDCVLEAVTDSTPIIRRLEREVEGRSVIPNDPALAFIDELIEDYADEWLTKAMFHYRWAHDADIRKASMALGCWSGYSIPDAALAERAQASLRRQTGRLGVVGSNTVTGPVIEASYRRFLLAFEAHLTQQPFLLGTRPAASDFAVFGQLSQLAQFEPTSMALTAEIAPRVYAWVSVMADLSGLELDNLDWLPLATVPATLIALLAEIGRVYPPVMLANARAVETGASEVTAEVDGKPWVQAPFPYQAKCVRWLRASYADLPSAARDQLGPLLEQTGLAGMFKDDGVSV